MEPEVAGFSQRLRMKFSALRIAAAFLAFATPLLANTALEAERKEGVGWERLHQRNVDRAKQGEIEILFLGDSITQYWSDARYGQKVWEKELLPLKAANFGINGDRIQHLLWRIRNGEAQGFQPRLVILLIGTNNTGYEKDRRTPRNSPEEVIEGIGEVARELQQRFPQSRILLLGLLPRGKAAAPVREQIRTINAGIARLDDGKRVVFRDIGGAFLNAEGEIPADLMADALHPGEKGYEVFVAAIRDELLRRD